MHDLALSISDHLKLGDVGNAETLAETSQTFSTLNGDAQIYCQINIQSIELIRYY